MNDYNKYLGRQIKKIRLNAGLSMDEFGKIFDPPVTRGTISKWENAKYLPNNKRLKKIAELSNVSVETLLENTRTDYISNLIEGKYNTRYPKKKILDLLIPLVISKNLGNDDFAILKELALVQESLDKNNFFPEKQKNAEIRQNTLLDESMRRDSLLKNSYTVINNLMKDTLIGTDGIVATISDTKNLVLYTKIIYLVRCIIKKDIPLNMDDISIDDLLIQLNNEALLKYGDNSKEWSNYLYDKDDIDYTTEIAEQSLNCLIKNIKQL